MRQGKRFKFHGSEIALLQDFGEDSPSLAITGITKANPAVVTAAGHGLSDGDVIKIAGVVGMIEVNDGIFVVVNSDDNTFELAGVDSLEYEEYTSGGLIAIGTMTNFCELTGYNRAGGTSAEIPATSLCSKAVENEIGLPDFGTTTLSFNFAPRTPVQGKLHQFFMSGDVIAVKVTLPKNGGEMVQLGFVQQESEQSAVGGLWTATAQIRNTGERVDIAAA